MHNNPTIDFTISPCGILGALHPGRIVESTLALKFRPIKQRPDQGQAGMAGQILVALFDDKFHRLHFSPPRCYFQGGKLSYILNNVK